MIDIGKINFLLFAKCLKVYSFFVFAFKVSKNFFPEKYQLKPTYRNALKKTFIQKLCKLDYFCFLHIFSWILLLTFFRSIFESRDQRIK
jgi:hypothetical protein